MTQTFSLVACAYIQSKMLAIDTAVATALKEQAAQPIRGNAHRHTCSIMPAVPSSSSRPPPPDPLQPTLAPLAPPTNPPPLESADVPPRPLSTGSNPRISPPPPPPPLPPPPRPLNTGSVTHRNVLEKPIACSTAGAEPGRTRGLFAAHVRVAQCDTIAHSLSDTIISGGALFAKTGASKTKRASKTACRRPGCGCSGRGRQVVPPGTDSLGSWNGCRCGGKVAPRNIMWGERTGSWAFVRCGPAARR